MKHTIHSFASNNNTKLSAINAGNTDRVNFTPSGFSNFCLNLVEYLCDKLDNPRGFKLWYFDGYAIAGGRP